MERDPPNMLWMEMMKIRNSNHSNMVELDHISLVKKIALIPDANQVPKIRMSTAISQLI
jgi:hypothetical protein